MTATLPPMPQPRPDTPFPAPWPNGPRLRRGYFRLGLLVGLDTAAFHACT